VADPTPERTAAGSSPGVAVATWTVSSPSASPLRATGTLRAGRQLPTAFAVGGVVSRLFVDEGQAVRAGDRLAALDAVPFEAEVDRAAARLDYLQARLARSEQLLEARAVGAEEVEEDRAERAGVAAQLRQARWRLERSTLRAPFDARVRSRSLEPGQVVSPGTAAFELLAVDTLEVEVAVPARDLARIDLAGPVIVSASDRPGRSYAARIAHAPVAGDARSGSVPVKIEVPVSDALLLPGLLVECVFTPSGRSDHAESVQIPVSAVRVGDDGPVVFRVEDGRAQEVSVQLDRVREDRVDVRAGLERGDRIVIDAPDRLRDGDPVRTRKEG
jgi:membrane fusion protein (multidrug efflux system)